MIAASRRQARLDQHVANLLQCRRCPRMIPPPVSGGPVLSRVILVGQAPGVKEPILARPFAWTAGRTLFSWFSDFCGMTEAQVRSQIYFAAVCRCFPGKNSAGGDRVPSPEEIRNCRSWLNDEMQILRPRLVIPVGKLAIAQFMAPLPLNEVIGKKFSVVYRGHAADCIPLPHPSGASPWHRMEPGKTLLGQALALVAKHEAMK